MAGAGALRARFRAPLDPGALALSASTEEDLLLLPYDLWGSVAHARMLGATGILPGATARRIEAGLKAIGADAARGRFPLDPALEDVHLNVETALTERIGPDGGRLHTARSRNDQVALDLALYLRDALRGLEGEATATSRSLLVAARAPSAGSVVAGWTHLQPAQALYWRQILATHALRFLRDAERFRGIRRRLTESPLGSGAIAGSSLPIDRHLSARLLGFRRPTASSLDGVSDRDALAETVFAASMTDLHAGALAEELVLGSMAGVDRVRLHDAFVTTSSLMPHKRNPDLAELVRAESGQSLGRLAGLLGVLKGLPIGYQRDLQATKPILFLAVARTTAILRVLARMAETAEYRPDPPRPERSTASVELADALVAAGRPFREAHERVARFVAEAEARGRGLASRDPAELEAAFPELRGSGFALPSASEEPDRRGSFGGSGRGEVERLLREVARRVAASERGLSAEARRVRRLRARMGVPEGWGFVPRASP